MRIYASCSNEFKAAKAATLHVMDFHKMEYTEILPQVKSMGFYNYPLNYTSLYKYTSSNAYEIKRMSQEFDGSQWDLVYHCMGSNNTEVYEIMQMRHLVKPGIIITNKANCWANLLDGFFITTVSDYYLIAMFPRMLHAIQQQTVKAVKANYQDIASDLEYRFYTDKNFQTNTDMMVELTNGSIIYIDDKTKQ